MYRQFFGIEEKPFSIAPDPHFLYMSDGHKEALAHLRFALEDDVGFVLLTGEIGAGKTTLCKLLLEQIPENTTVAFVLYPKLSGLELLLSICDELGVDYQDGCSVKVLIDDLHAFLLDSFANGRRTVLIIDEAQNLNADVLEQVRLLTNLETSQKKLLQVIMLGQPELREKLAQPELKQLSQRISARYHLGPLSAEDTKAYVLFRLSVVGLGEQVFSQNSLKQLYERTGGIPRLINMICDRAMLAAYTKGTKTVNKGLLEESAHEVFGKEIEDVSLKIIPRWLVAGATCLACAVIVLMITLSSTFMGGSTDSSGRSASVNKKIEKIVMSEKDVAKQAAPSVEKKISRFDEVEWPSGELAGKSESLAFEGLLKAWGLTGYSSGDEWACNYAEKNNLRCLTNRGSVEDISRLNRPVMLRMINDDQQVFFMLVTGIDDDFAVLKLGDEELRVSIEDMALQWSGYYVLLWRPPPGYTDSIRPGQKGKVVRWLAGQVAIIKGDAYKGGIEKNVFDSTLVEHVKKIQYDNKLVPDGIVGKETLILLNTLAGKNIPVLRKK